MDLIILVLSLVLVVWLNLKLFGYRLECIAESKSFVPIIPKSRKEPYLVTIECIGPLGYKRLRFVRYPFVLFNKNQPEPTLETLMDNESVVFADYSIPHSRSMWYTRIGNRIIIESASF